MNFCFSEHFYYEAPLGNSLIHVQVAEIQPPDIVKNYLQGTFQTFYTKARVAIRGRLFT